MVAISCLAGWALGATVTLTDRTITDFTLVGTATATLRIDNDGTVKNQDATTLETWLTGSPTTSNYDVRVTIQSGEPPTGLDGMWLNCGTDRTWSVSNSAGDGSTVTSVILVEIRHSASGTVQDSATITLEAISS